MLPNASMISWIILVDVVVSDFFSAIFAFLSDILLKETHPFFIIKALIDLISLNDNYIVTNYVLHC